MCCINIAMRSVLSAVMRTIASGLQTRGQETSALFKRLLQIARAFWEGVVILRKVNGIGHKDSKILQLTQYAVGIGTL